MIGLDGSDTLLRATAAQAAPVGGRVDLRRVSPGGAGVSNGAAGRPALHRQQPGESRPRRAGQGSTLSRASNAEVEWQPREIGDCAHRQFLADQWNFHESPVSEDDIDSPSTTVEQPQWLARAGFTGVDVFGHGRGTSCLAATKSV